MRYFEFFLTDNMGYAPSQDEDCDSICVKASRPPKDVMEATKWVMSDLEPLQSVFDFRECSREEAAMDFDMENVEPCL